jgi:type IV pilus biogenesis protein CpaD/CtpE
MPRRDAKLGGLLLGLAAMLSACTDPEFYTDRREGITLHAGNAAASNIAEQVIDPWPAASVDRRPVADGERTQKAIERYRTNKIIPPQGSGTSSVQFTPLLAAPVAASGSGQ